MVWTDIEKRRAHHRAYSKKWRKLNRLKHNKYGRISYHRHKDKHKMKRSKNAKHWRLLAKIKVFEHYCPGRIECACCREDKLVFLTIDHMKGDGNKHRREVKTVSGSGVHTWLIKNNFPVGFQVLCFNCNVGKYFNGGVCPHKEVV